MQKSLIFKKFSQYNYLRFNSNLSNKNVKHHSVSVKLSNSEFKFSTGHLARFANGAVELCQNDNAILGIVVSKYRKPTIENDIIGFPTFDLQLSVDFRQSAAAIGRIPTNYLRREMQQTDQDIITSRIIDRSIRPIFLQNYQFPTNVICKPLSADETCDNSILGINVASAALAISSVPLRCIVAAVRIGIVDKKIIINPTIEQLKNSTLNLVVSGNNLNKFLMIDMDGKEIKLDNLIECFNLGFEEINKLIDGITQLAKLTNNTKYELQNSVLHNELLNKCELYSKDKLTLILRDFTHDKTSRDTAIFELRDAFIKHIMEEQNANTINENLIEKYNYNLLSACFTYYFKKLIKTLTIDSGIRCDGRNLNEFRPITIKTNVYSRLHGSALFQRGQSQVFSTVTFDSPQSAFHPDSIAQILGAQQKKSFMLHYEFPQFAINEIGSAQGNRREIGHGMLAEKALKHLIPTNFPYTIRLASQVLESNGSTSMAAVCAGSLSLFDAGVQLDRAVAGAAIGLFTKENENGNGNDCNDLKYVFLTDILGLEDFYGDMDFKIAGTTQGITAMQLDLKICGLTFNQLKEALNEGRLAINYVLNKMNNVIDKPRIKFKDSVPIIETWTLPSHYRRNILFRRNAYNAKLVESETGVQITAEDEQAICLLAPNKNKLEKAKELIKNILQEQNDVEFIFGAYYKAEIVEILEHGVMVTLQKGTRPILLHNSALSNKKIGHASVLNLNIGNIITVKYFGRDKQGFHRITAKTISHPDIAIQNLIKK